MTTRPRILHNASRIAIGLGALMVMSSGMGLLMSQAMPPVSDLPQDPNIYFPTWVFQHFAALATGEVIVGAVTVLAGFGLRRRQAWARHFLEALAWVALAYVLGFSIIWARSAVSMTHTIATSMPFPRAMFVVMGVLVTLSLGVAVLFALRALRSRAMRDALSGAPTPAEAGA